MKKLNKKGFTLVEVIVVLVILAILIAIAVPSVMKYIDDAKDAQVMAQAKGFAQEIELTMIEELGKREATTWEEFENLVNAELEKEGYAKGMFGESTTDKPPIYTDEWQAYFIMYTIVNKNGDVLTGSDGYRGKKIAYNEDLRIKKISFSMIKTSGGVMNTRRYDYIPNEELKLISKFPK